MENSLDFKAIQGWNSQKDKIGIVVSSDKQELVQMADRLATNINLSLGPKPGFLKSDSGRLAVVVSADRSKFYKGAPTSGFFFTQVAESVAKTITNGPLKAWGRIQENESKDLLKMFTADDILAKLNAIAKSSKLEQIVLLCPDFENIELASRSKILSLISSSDSINKVALLIGLSDQNDPTLDLWRNRASVLAEKV